MTDLNRTASTTYIEPAPRIGVASRKTMLTTGPLFSSSDIAAGIVAAVMTLGPLAMAAFAVGRY